MRGKDVTSRRLLKRRATYVSATQSRSLLTAGLRFSENKMCFDKTSKLKIIDPTHFDVTFHYTIGSNAASRSASPVGVQLATNL